MRPIAVAQDHSTNDQINGAILQCEGSQHHGYGASPAPSQATDHVDGLLVFAASQGGHHSAPLRVDHALARGEME